MGTSTFHRSFLDAIASKKCYGSFSRDTCPNSIVYNNVRTPILASSGQNELGKKF